MSPALPASVVHRAGVLPEYRHEPYRTTTPHRRWQPHASNQHRANPRRRVSWPQATQPGVQPHGSPAHPATSPRRPAPPLGTAAYERCLRARALTIMTATTPVTAPTPTDEFPVRTKTK